jgi:hypothetical protein
LSVADPDTWVAHANRNIHTDSHCNSYVYANGNCNSYGNCDSNGNCNCVRIAAAYPDAQAASDACATPISFRV